MNFLFKPSKDRFFFFHDFEEINRLMYPRKVNISLNVFLIKNFLVSVLKVIKLLEILSSKIKEE